MSKIREHRLEIIIDRPIKDVFNFSFDSSKLPLWFDAIAEEIPSEVPPRLGTILRNRNVGSKQWHEYKITTFTPEKMIELTQMNGNYHVQYIYTPISENATRLEYCEWVDDGEPDPIQPSTLEKLKFVLENEMSERSSI